MVSNIEQPDGKSEKENTELEVVHSANPTLKGDENLIQTGEFFERGNTILERIHRSKGLTDPKVANAANYWGINHLNNKGPIAGPSVGMGYVFFTRPRLRLTYDNLLKHRTFAMMADGDPNSVMSIIRAYLDPVGHSADNFTAPLVDKRNPFISALSNQCKSATGWPETPVSPYTSREGIMGETYSLADGKYNNYGLTSISTSFENVANDFISNLFHIWTQYMMLSHRGVMMPYMDDWLYNRVNYNTRIYRLVTDPTGEVITDFAMTGSSMPLNSGKAAIYDYNADDQYQTGIEEVSIEFQSNGVVSFDPIVLKQFNKTVLMFCPQMHDSQRHKYFHRLNFKEKPYFVHHAIPYINLRDFTLGWYVDKSLYEVEMKILGGL